MLKHSTGTIAKLYPSAISPQPHMIAIYVVGILILQVGYCILLVFARNPDTKRALIKACGWPLMLSNWVMALAAVAWVGNQDVPHST